MKYTPKSPAVLVLQDGTVFYGKSAGKVGTATGEICFNTGMTGYQEVFTDPSYKGQLLLATNVHIGNYGITDEESESNSIKIAGLICRNFSQHHSRKQADASLTDYFIEQNIVAICEIDTRALVRHIRNKGAMNGIISSESLDVDVLKRTLSDVPSMEGLELSSTVSTKEPYVVPSVGKTLYKVAAIDLGMKNGILHNLTTRGIELTVLPVSATADEVLAAGIDGVFLSNGPGDPETAKHAISVTQEVLKANRALFGICFGNQILGRAVGFETYKLTFGHRGINQPVLDRTTGKVEITTHNHGFAVKAPIDKISDTEFGRVEVSHICLNDNVVEGLALKDKPAFSVQYHPEAAAGPHDAQYLFDRFTNLMDKNNA